MRIYQGAIVLVLGFLTPLSPAQTDTSAVAAPQDEEAIHNELRAIREGLVDAVLKGDVERQLSYVHDNVVVTWQNGEVARGHQGLRDFLDRTGSEVFQGYTVLPAADELTILYGDNTGIVFGSSVPHYKLLGREFDLNNRWTATLVKENGRWLIASYHVSGNILDNPLLTVAKRGMYWVGGIALVVGLVVGMFGGKIVRRLRKTAA